MTASKSCESVTLVFRNMCANLLCAISLICFTHDHISYTLRNRHRIYFRLLLLCHSLFTAKWPNCLFGRVTSRNRGNDYSLDSLPLSASQETFNAGVIFICLRWLHDLLFESTVIFHFCWKRASWFQPKRTALTHSPVTLSVMRSEAVGERTTISKSGFVSRLRTNS